MTKFDRRSVLLTGGFALAHRALPKGSPVSPVAEERSAAAFTPETAAPIGAAVGEDPWPTFPSQDPEKVYRVVLASHTDFDTVQELVRAHPALSRASIDWGFGDWESALGAASHMGRRDIAEFLIEQGARPNIFSAAMLGQLAAVKALVAASPGVQRIPGPHGITLLSHARAGGEQAASVVAYLEELGDADIRPETVEMTAEQRAVFIGTYAFGSGDNDYFEVTENRERLSARHGGRQFGRMLFPVSDREFYPSGSPTVRLAFELEDERATSLTVIDNEVILTAQRRP